MSRARLVHVLLVLCSLILFSPSSVAQLPQASDTTSPPIPGVGHDYLGGSLDTVNPANGSVSIRIPIRVSPGRQLTIPFSIAYDSAGAFYYGQGPGGGGTPGYMTTTNVAFTRGGWSYTLPLLTNTSESWIQQYSSGKNYTCLETVNYVLQDATGNRHNMGMAALKTPVGGDCGSAIMTGGEGPIVASLSGSNLITATITDGNGTTYAFPSAGFTVSNLVPTSIIDRNGNIVSISSTSSTASVTDTLGRTAFSVGSFLGNPDNISVAGLASPYQASWTTASAHFTISQTNLQPGVSQNCPTSLTGSASVISQVVLPNGQKFTFTYDPTYGMLSKVTSPSGGYVRYVWGLNSQSEVGRWAAGTTSWDCRYDFPAITDRYVSFNGATEVLHQHFAYNTSWSGLSANYTSKTTTVTTYDLVRSTNFTTVNAYAGVSSPCVPDLNPNTAGCLGNPTQETPLEQCIESYDSSGSGGTPPAPCPNLSPSGKLLKTVIKSWYSNNVRTLGSEQITLDNSQSSLTVNCYNANEQLTETDSYDFGTSAVTPPSCANNFPAGTVAGPLLRKTTETYATFTPHIVEFPSTVITYDGSGNRAAETDYTYDSPAGTVTSGIVQHSGSCNCGNLTKESRWVNSSGSTLATNYTNDDTGQRLTMTDPRGDQTTYSYADSYSSGTPPGPTNAYLTQITLPNTGVAHIEKFAYAYASGELTSSTDQNNFVTTYKYVDNLARLTEIDYPTPDGGATTYAYTDTPNAVSVESKHQIDSSRWTDAFTLYNGLGLPIAQSTANGEATPWNRVDSCYDGTSRVLLSSYPYQVSSATVAPNCTSGAGDTMTYDALGRTTQVSHSDGNTILHAYTGRAAEVQDEGDGAHRVQRISQADGLGRLISVCEVTSASQLGNGGTPTSCGQDIAATGFLTSYGYNALGDLLSVTQGTLNTRSFNYDFLSRLNSATNPESGAITYKYDSDSSCANPNFAGLLVSKLDARSIRTCFQYDALNRTTQKNYSDGTPTATFNFDQTSAYGVTLTNTTGRLTSQSTASPNPTGQVFSYDQLGRVKINSQCTPQNCSSNTVFPVMYTYDLLGDKLTSTNGAGVTLTYAYNVVPALTTLTSSLSDSNHPGTLLSSAHYNSAGSLLSATLGGSVSETRTYDTRLRLASIADGSNYSLTIPSSGGYAPNSDILTANDSVNSNWVYAYDDFNRLICSNLAANGTCANPTSGPATYTYDYDRYGNRWHQNGAFSMQLSFSGNNNRMDSHSYDSAGNLLNDGSHNYFYDAENRLIQVDGTLGTCSSATACYVYNASGRRVRKTTGSASIDYLYDLGGQEITELGSAGAWNRGEVYAGGRHLATYKSGTTNLIHADWLGTERVRTTAAGASCETIASLPFGDGQSTSGSCGDPSPLHFTGKERDSESGLDNFGARYNSSNLGRFMSSDPRNSIVIRQGMKAGGLPEAAADAFFDGFLENPENWNEYIYALNNPLRLVDPTGAAPQEGHHLFVERSKMALDALGRNFVDKIRTGPLSGNRIPNVGFSGPHREYNEAVKQIFNEAVKEEGDANNWSVQQWKDLANNILNSDEPAIKNFLDELEENNPGARAALASSIATYRVTASVIARVAISSAAARLRGFFQILILCVNCNELAPPIPKKKGDINGPA